MPFPDDFLKECKRAGAFAARKPQIVPVRFFRIWGRKFWQLVQLNLLLLLPVLGVLLLMITLEFFAPHYLLRLPDGEVGVQWCRWFMFSHPAPGEMDGVWVDVWALWGVPLPLVLLSPLAAGLAFVTRNFTREEHAFVWWDFWEAVKANWKPFLLNGVFCYLLYALLSVSVLFYGFSAVHQPLYHFPLWVCIMLATLFLFAQYYLPVLLITFDLSFRQAYKNALILAVTSLGRNLLLSISLLFLALFYSLPLLNGAILIGFNILIFALLFLFIGWSVSMLLVHCTVYPVIDRHMIQPYKQKVLDGNQNKKGSH